ncbi:hypothetical protein YC2023_069965 [Brassica napus]
MAYTWSRTQQLVKQLLITTLSGGQSESIHLLFGTNGKPCQATMDRASMLLMYQTVSYLFEMFRRLQSSSMMIEWLALPIAAASQIEDSYPHLSPLKLGVKLVKRKGVLIRLMTWRLTWKLQRIIYLMESLCRWEEDEI